MRQGADLFNERLIDLMGDDRRALGHKCPQAAGVIEVRMGVDDIANGLIRNQFLGLRDDCAGALFTLRSLNDDDVILEIHGNGGIAAENQIHAFAQFLRGRGGCRGTAALRLRRLDVSPRRWASHP
jgi:hypothetical protein